MIEACDITKFYHVQGKKRYVFKDLSLKIDSGESLALLGPNGAGKSTLLRLLCGIEMPNKGEIFRRCNVSWPVGIGKGVIKNLTGIENVKFVCRLFNKTRNETKTIVDFVGEFSELADYYSMPVSTYSSGMRSRLAFGLSMAFEFDCYIIDEVMSVGDLRFKTKCKEIFAERANGKGIIMVSHSLADVKTFCNRGLYLNKGKVVYSENILDTIEMYKNESQGKKINTSEMF